jgi:hypothetical protein
MKKLLLYSLALFALPAMAQISIDLSDMAVVGDVISRKADTLTPITGPGSAGANQTWTMTTISSNPTYILNENTSVVTVASTPYAAQFSGSNISMTNDNVSYVYINQNSTTMTTQGGAGDLLLLGNTIVAPLNPDLKLHNFPRTYNSTFTDNYATDITINGSVISPLVSQVRYKRVATVTDVTDGWGSITTPNGTYNDVLRVKRTDHGKDTIWILPTIGFPPAWSVFSTKDDTSFSYQWLGKEMKLAVAELNYDSLDQPKTFKWTLLPPPGTVGVSENANSTNAELFPVPASENVSLRLGNELEAGEYFFTVYDVAGKMLMQEKVYATANSTYNFSVQNLPQGLYAWQFMDRNNLHKAAGKLSIVR